MFKGNDKDIRKRHVGFEQLFVCLFEPCLLCSVRSCFFGLYKEIVLRTQKLSCEKVKNLHTEDELTLIDINLRY